MDTVNKESPLSDAYIRVFEEGTIELKEGQAVSTMLAVRVVQAVKGVVKEKDLFAARELMDVAAGHRLTDRTLEALGIYAVSITDPHFAITPATRHVLDDVLKISIAVPSSDFPYYVDATRIEAALQSSARKAGCAADLACAARPRLIPLRP